MEYEEIKRLKENSKSSLSLHFFFGENDELINMGVITHNIGIKRFAEKYNISELLNILVNMEQKGLEIESEQTQQKVDELFKKPFTRND